MPNGFQGCELEWQRIEAPLLRVDSALRARGIAMRNDEIWLVGMFSFVSCVLAVWPRSTVKVLSYGKPPKSEWLIDAFRLMGCAGLALVVIRGTLSAFF
jgi:hypothetical protein